MSTLALESSSNAREGGTGSGTAILRHADLVLLALALPVFVVAGWPLLGYAAAAVAWIAQHVVWVAAQRQAAVAVERGERNRAMGIIGFSTLGRLWIVTIAILLVGVLGEDEAGLAAGILSAVLVTAHLGSQALGRLFGGEGESSR